MKIPFLFLLLLVTSLSHAQSPAEANIELTEFLQWRLNELRENRSSRPSGLNRTNPIILMSNLLRFDSSFVERKLEKDEYAYGSEAPMFAKYKSFYDTIQVLFTSDEIEVIKKQSYALPKQFSEKFVKQINQGIKIKRKQDRYYYKTTIPLVVGNLFIVGERFESSPSYWIHNIITIYERIGEYQFKETKRLSTFSYGY